MIGCESISRAPSTSSRPLIARIVELATEADEQGYPVIALALLGVARVSRMDLPIGICQTMANTCIMLADSIEAAYRRKS